MEQYHANNEKRIILNLTRRGQLNLPVEAQRYLGVKSESQLQLVLADGKAYLEPVSMSLEDVFGSIKFAEPGKDLDKIIEEAREERAGKFLEKYNQE
ncbi:MAG TPA: hypothetical protein VGL94_10965 [Ktedonobacteraceae bacterium]|jgi:bifunctional DNA-binding transcriptional regulator/antitoxin component of YhaV-PrlF toxin-antitoxin module